MAGASARHSATERVDHWLPDCRTARPQKQESSRHWSESGIIHRTAATETFLSNIPRRLRVNSHYAEKNQCVNDHERSEIRILQVGRRADLRIQPANGHWHNDSARNEFDSPQRPRSNLTTATLFTVRITQPCFESGVFSRLIAS
jgi:hypothetical protein